MNTEPGDTYDAILTAALEVFLRYGFAKTSMKDLAQAAELLLELLLPSLLLGPLIRP